MLFIKSFSNYEEFKNVFGMTEHGNGVKSRKNAILLSQYKNKHLWKFCREHGNYYPFTIDCMSELENWAKDAVSNVRFGDIYGYTLDIVGFEFHSRLYKFDHMRGMCEDNGGDDRNIRYLSYANGNDGKPYMMKVGKLVGKIMNETPLRNLFSEQVKTWLRETITEKWVGYKSRYTLHLGSSLDDFEGIYGGFNYIGNFGSCMMDEEQHYFYANAVNATAAWLENEDGDMVARCVIFNDVRTQSGERLRLAERQYASDGDTKIMTALVSKLVEGGYIDGYKKIGAGCHDTRAFVRNDGSSLYNETMRINCNLNDGDTLSYQDSFKYYNIDEGIAYNTDINGYTDELDTTSREFYASNERVWDDYHEYYCAETRPVYASGREYYCDVEDLDDFVYVDSRDEYHHVNDVVEVERYGEYYLDSDCVWNERFREYILNDESIECADGDFYWEDECVECADGEYRYKDDCAMCRECGKYFETDELDAHPYDTDTDTYICTGCYVKLKETEGKAV